MSGISDPNTDPVQAMLAQASLTRTAFAPSSRYYASPILSIQSGGQTVAYLARRFPPQPDSLQVTQTVTVAQGDRPDLLAATWLGDPTLFWRLCDANAVDRPSDLTAEPGRVLAITLPSGVRGASL